MTGFDTSIKPLFRERDRESMAWVFDLWDRDDVSADAENILERLKDGTMPCDEKWSSDKIALFQRWMDEGCKP